ncbi:MAG: hypothetical protein AB1796_04020 [Bacillota bacterium]
MLKQIAALGTTGKDRKPPLPVRKNSRPRQGKDCLGETHAEILELSPLARFMTAFRHTACRHETTDTTFTFVLEARGDAYTTHLKGQLDLQDHTWSVYWKTDAAVPYPDAKEGFIAAMKHFLKMYGVKKDKKEERSFSLTLRGAEGMGTLALSGKGLQDMLHHLLMQVVLLAALPFPKGGRERQRQIFRAAGDDYQTLRERCSFYFPWSGMKELHITLQF